MLQFRKNARRNIQPPAGCDTLGCSKCGKLSFTIFVEPVKDQPFAVTREFLCANPKCGAVCKVERGTIQRGLLTDLKVPVDLQQYK